MGLLNCISFFFSFANNLKNRKLEISFNIMYLANL